MQKPHIADKRDLDREGTRVSGNSFGIASKPENARRFYGMFTRRERWGLSGRAWFLVTLLFLALLIGGTVTIYPFLAVTDRVNANILAVEGWIHDYAIQAGIDELKSGNYRQIFVTGGPVRGNGAYTTDYDTSAHVGASRLGALGMSSGMVQMVPAHVIGRDRTYSAAVALREWFRQHGIEVRSINVVTENVHARRTRLVFAEAFGPKVAIGIVAVPDPDYDPKYWWRYSEGVREVIGETIAYVYAKFFFYPPG